MHMCQISIKPVLVDTTYDYVIKYRCICMYSSAIHVIIYRPEADLKKRICFLPKNIRFISRNRRNINNVINDSQEAQKVNYYFICSGNTFAAHSCYAEFFHTKLFCAAMSKLIRIAVFFFCF